MTSLSIGRRLSLLLALLASSSLASAQQDPPILNAYVSADGSYDEMLVTVVEVVMTPRADGRGFDTSSRELMYEQPMRYQGQGVWTTSLPIPGGPTAPPAGGSVFRTISVKAKRDGQTFTGFSGGSYWTQ